MRTFTSKENLIYNNYVLCVRTQGSLRARDGVSYLANSLRPNSEQQVTKTATKAASQSLCILPRIKRLSHCRRLSLGFSAHCGVVGSLGAKACARTAPGYLRLRVL